MVNRLLREARRSGADVQQVLVQLSGSNLEAGRYHETGLNIARLAYGSAAVAIVGALGRLVIARRRGLVLLALGRSHDSRRRRQLRGGRGGHRPRQGRTHRRRGFGPCGERGDRRHRARQSA